MQYTFTPDELRELLAQTIKTFAEFDSVFFFSAAMEESMRLAIETIVDRLELPADIPFDGQSVAHETTDNISEAELGLMPTF